MHSVNYANERKQFDSLIANFGAIKYKLAEMVVRTWGIESALYRTSRYVDDTIDLHVAQGMERTQAYLQAIGEYAMEAAILKVLGSESQDYIVDEAVQVHGGMGFSAEMPVDRCYRDSRINRIFEGTNEINRLVCADMLLKQAKKADSVIFAKAKEIYDSIDSFKNEAILTDDYFAYYEKVSIYMKQVVLLVMSRAYETLGSKYSTEQEVMMHISDIAIQAYAAESLYLRVKKLAAIYDSSKGSNVQKHPRCLRLRSRCPHPQIGLRCHQLICRSRRISEAQKRRNRPHYVETNQHKRSPSRHRQQTHRR